MTKPLPDQSRLQAALSLSQHGERTRKDVQNVLAPLEMAHATPPHRVLLCLGPCHGEFYLPLDRDEAEVCPNDREHPVAVYGMVGVRP